MSFLDFRSDATVTSLTKALYAVLAIAAAIAAWCGIQFVSSKTAAGEAKAMANNHRSKLNEFRDVIARAEQLPPPAVPAGLAAVGAFQSAFENAAVKAGADLTEFTSSRTPAAYLSRYSKDAPETTWSQVEVKLQLQGTARSILQTLDSVADLDIPFELITVELNRQATKQLDEALLTASVELNILIQPVEETP